MIRIGRLAGRCVADATLSLFHALWIASFVRVSSLVVCDAVVSVSSPVLVVFTVVLVADVEEFLG